MIFYTSIGQTLSLQGMHQEHNFVVIGLYVQMDRSLILFHLIVGTSMSGCITNIIISSPAYLHQNWTTLTRDNIFRFSSENHPKFQVEGRVLAPPRNVKLKLPFKKSLNLNFTLPIKKFINYINIWKEAQYLKLPIYINFSIYWNSYSIKFNSSFNILEIW